MSKVVKFGEALASAEQFKKVEISSVRIREEICGAFRTGKDLPRCKGDGYAVCLLLIWQIRQELQKQSWMPLRRVTRRL